jgi:hypothetical protein
MKNTIHLFLVNTKKTKEVWSDEVVLESDTVWSRLVYLFINQGENIFLEILPIIFPPHIV